LVIKCRKLLRHLPPSVSVLIPKDTSGYYTHCQRFLLGEIAALTREGWNHVQIARFFHQRGYLTVRGKPFLGKHIWSMVKKSRLT